MRKRTILIISCLTAANVAVGVALVQVYSSTRAVHANTDGLLVSDLTYGEIDTNGDGACDFTDDFVTEWLLENSPEVLRQAAAEGVVRTDGTVDISGHLNDVAAERAMLFQSQREGE